MKLSIKKRCDTFPFSIDFCPTRNIELHNGRPVWHHRCHGCMACVAYCPVRAIQFSTPEAYLRLNTVITRRLGLPPTRKRYHHPRITAADLAADRRYISARQPGQR